MGRKTRILLECDMILQNALCQQLQMYNVSLLFCCTSDIILLQYFAYHPLVRFIVLTNHSQTAAPLLSFH